MQVFYHKLQPINSSYQKNKYTRHNDRCVLHIYMCNDDCNQLKSTNMFSKGLTVFSDSDLVHDNGYNLILNKVYLNHKILKLNL